MSEVKKQQVIALGRLGWSLRRIEQETGVRRETAASYLKAAGVEVRPPGRWGHPTAKPAIEVTPDSPAAGGAKPAIEVTPDPDAAKRSSPSRSQAYQEYIEAGLAQGRNAKGIWQDLVDEHGFTGSYQSVKRYVSRLAGPRTPTARAVIQTPPGEEAQVDYGTGPLVRDPATGKYRRTRLFVFTLAHSRKCVRLLTFASSARQWVELHEQTLRRLGGAPKVIVLDNLKEGVLKADIYDPTLNPLYRDMLKHYGIVALPCRVADPDRKGKVERSVGHAQATPLKGKRFETLAAAQDYLDHWESRWADTRIHGTTKRQVAAMFAEEKPALTPLPLTPFRYYRHGERRVHLDGCVEVEAVYYSTPPGWIGRTVHVQWDEQWVRVLAPATGELLREHRRGAERGRHRIAETDRSPRTPPGVQALLARARQTGPHFGQLCQSLHERHGVVAVRRIQGMFSLVKKYGVATVEQACELALNVHQPEYHFVNRYLKHQEPFPLTLQQVDPLIRELTVYRDVIQARLDFSTGEKDPL